MVRQLLHLFLKKIADKIYSLTPKKVELDNIKIEDYKQKQLTNSLKLDGTNFSIIKGKNLKNVLPALENLGYNVFFKGKGYLIKNYKINKSINNVEIELI